MRMKCYFDYCIYNKNLICALKKTEINSAGMCDSCRIVYLDNEFLKNEKKRQLRKQQKRRGLNPR